MKTKLFITLPFLAILALGCKQKPASTAKIDSTAKDTPTNTTASAPVDSLNTEYLDYNIIKIDGKMGIYGNQKQLIAALGKADSIKSFDEKSNEYECGTQFEKPLSVVYINGASYEMKNDSVAFSAIKFNKATGAFIQAGNLRLSAATTLAEIRKLYPASAKAGAELNAYGYSEPVFSISISPSSQPSEAKWVFLFDKKTGKLLEIHSWLPC